MKIMINSVNNFTLLTQSYTEFLSDILNIEDYMTTTYQLSVWIIVQSLHCYSCKFSRVFYKGYIMRSLWVSHFEPCFLKCVKLWDRSTLFLPVPVFPFSSGRTRKINTKTIQGTNTFEIAGSVYVVRGKPYRQHWE